jgi:hypothetical protein
MAPFLYSGCWDWHIFLKFFEYPDPISGLEGNGSMPI